MWRQIGPMLLSWFNFGTFVYLSYQHPVDYMANVARILSYPFMAVAVIATIAVCERE
jgi:hypothetical protein